MASVRLSDYDRRRVCNRVEEIFRARHLVTDPIPYSAKEVYHALAMPEEQYKRVMALDAEVPGLIRMVSDFYIEFFAVRREGSSLKKMTFMVDLPGDFPVPNTHGTYRTTLPLREGNDIWPAFMKHADEIHTTNLQNRKALDVVKRFMDMCRTGGQVRLLWPEMVNLLSKEDQRHLGSTIARKPPYEWTDGYINPLLFQSEMRWTTPILTQGIMLESANGGVHEVREKLYNPEKGVRSYELG